jgi:hypothetical protein
MSLESNLRSQLNNLKSKQKPEPVLPKNAESTFLFDFKTSKRIDTDTVYELGYNGIIELSRLNENFINYIPKLFGPTSKYYNRETKTDEENKNLDKILNEFIVDLVPYFVTKHSHKVIEYLIKIFKVHVYNHKILLLSFLPYYDTKYFTKLIQNVNFDRNKNFGFLSTFAKNGVVILKEFLLKEFNSNFDFLMEVFSFYESFVVNKDFIFNEEYSLINPNVYFDFMNEILKNLLKQSKQSSENILNLVIKFIHFNLKAFRNDYASNNKTTAICQLVIILCTKFYISKEYKSAIFNDIMVITTKSDSKNVIEKILQTVLILLTNSEDLLLNETSVSKLSSSFYEGSVLKGCLYSLSNKYDLSPFTICVIKSSQSEEAQDLVFGLMKSLYISQEGLNKIIDSLLSDRKAEESVGAYLRLIGEIHSEKFDSYLLSTVTKGSDKDKLTSLRNLITSAGVNSSFSLDTEFELLLAINSTNTTTTLQAIKKLDEEASKGQSPLVDYLIPSLAFKFDSNASEIALKEILTMKNIKQLILQHNNLRLAILDLFSRIIEQDLQLYTHNLIALLISTILSYCLARDIFSLKLVIYMLVFIDNKNLNEIFKECKESVLYTILKHKSFKVKELSFENLVTFITAERAFIVLFYKILYHLLTTVKKDKCLPYLQIIIQLSEKTGERSKLYKIITILKDIIYIENLDESLYRHFSMLIINMIPQNYISENMFIYTNTFLVLSAKWLEDGYSDLVSTILSKYYKKESQIFLANLLINNYEVVDKALEMLNNNTEDNIELALLVNLIYLLTCEEVKNQKTMSSVFELICKFKTRKLAINDFNSLFTANNKPKPTVNVNIDTSQIINFISENRNEIMSNQSNLRKVINNCANINNVFYVQLIEIFVGNISQYSAKGEIKKVLDLFNDKTYKFTNTQVTEILNILKHALDNKNLNTDKDILYITERVLKTLLVSEKGLLQQLLKFIINYNDIVFPQALIELFITNLGIIKFDKKNLSFFIETLDICLRKEYTVPSESFAGLNISYPDLLDYLIEHAEKHTIVSYVFDILITNNNAYVSEDYIIKTLKIIATVKDIYEPIFLTMCNNLLTIIINSTFDKQEAINSIISSIEVEILKVIKESFRFDRMDTDDYDTGSNNIITSNVLNILFLCLNNLIKKNSQSNKAIIKDIIIKCFKSLDVPGGVANREISLTLIKSIHNFIELLFMDSTALNESEYIDYIHYFIKYSLQFIHNNKIIEEFLTNFMKVILKNEHLTIYYLLELSYHFNESEEAKCKIGEFKNYLDKVDFEHNGLNRLLTMVDFILKEFNHTISQTDSLIKETIFNITNEKKEHLTKKLNNSVVLLDQIVNLNESLFFDKAIMGTIKTEMITSICSSLSEIFKALREGDKFKQLLVALGSFQDYFFDILSESKIIHNCVLLIYDNYSQEARNYFLVKYFDILITNEKLSKNTKIFEYLLTNYSTEKSNENLQIVFSILTKIITGDKSFSDTLDEKAVNDLISFIKKRENIVTKFSGFIFLSKVYCLFETKYLDSFNTFVDLFVSEMDKITNPELANLVIETLNYISVRMSEYLSFKLNELVLKLLQLNSNFSSAITGQTLLNLSQKQLFDTSYECVKYCIKNKDKFNSQSFALLMEFFKNSLKLADKLTIANLYQKIFKFFIRLLLDKTLVSSTESILDTFKTFMLKINEKQLKVLFTDLMNYATEEKEQPDTFKYVIENCVISFELLNTILKTIGSIFVVYFENYKNYLLELLIYLNATFASHHKEPKKKKSRQFFDEAFTDENNKFSFLNLNSLILDNIKLNFIQNEDKLVYDTIEELFEPVINQVNFILI